MKIIELHGSATTVEIDADKKEVYISEYGEHIFRLSFDDVKQIQTEIFIEIQRDINKGTPYLAQLIVDGLSK